MIVKVFEMDTHYALGCPNSVQQSTDLGVCASNVTYNLPTVFDNCAATRSLLQGHTSDSAFNLGTTVVSYLVQDPSGNNATCQFTVNIFDGEKPVVSEFIFCLLL